MTLSAVARRGHYFLAVSERSRRGESGMTLIEVLLASVIGGIVLLVLVAFVHQLVRWDTTSAQNRSAHAALHRLSERWSAEAQSAEAIFIPQTDIKGADNRATPHEIDFYVHDAYRRPAFWAYYYNGSTVQRYDYASPGAAPQPDGDTYGGVTKFVVEQHPLSDIANAASDIYVPLFASGPATAVAQVKLGYAINDITGAFIHGGNDIVHIDLASAQEEMPIDLATGTAPSGFEVAVHYTPKPGDLKTWPIAVAYGPNNTDVADATRLPVGRDLAWFINTLFGGGTARASGCHAIAYKDTAMTIVDANNSAFAALGASTDPAGCYNGAMVAYEADGSSATYNPNFANCGLSVLPGSWTPASATGTQAALSVGTGGPIASCNVILNDGGGIPPSSGAGLIVAQVLSPAIDLTYEYKSFCDQDLGVRFGPVTTTLGALRSDLTPFAMAIFNGDTTGNVNGKILSQELATYASLPDIQPAVVSGFVTLWGSHSAC